MRESPALHIAEKLLNADTGEIYVVDPHVKAAPPSIEGKPRMHFVGLQDALKEADIVVLLVQHDQFRDLDRRLLAEKT